MTNSHRAAITTTSVGFEAEDTDRAFALWERVLAGRVATTFERAMRDIRLEPGAKITLTVTVEPYSEEPQQ